MVPPALFFFHLTRIHWYHTIPIPHPQAVPLDKSKRVKVIPSGGYLVPEIKVGDGDDAEIVTGSETILHWIDQHFAQAQLYPTPLCSELSVRASDHKLAGFVWYYNWVDDAGFGRSILEPVRGALPSWMLPRFIPSTLLQLPLRSERTKFRHQARTAMDVTDDDLDDEPRMRQLLVQELEFFQAQLQDAAQPYLVPGTTQPTAADFSVYPQVERLVGGNDGAYDVGLPPALPALKQEASLERLWQWHARMQKECPVQFKDKKPPVAGSRL